VGKDFADNVSFQAFVAQLAVQALDERILRWLAGCCVMAFRVRPPGTLMAQCGDLHPTVMVKFGKTVGRSHFARSRRLHARSPNANQQL